MLVRTELPTVVGWSRTFARVETRAIGTTGVAVWVTVGGISKGTDVGVGGPVGVTSGVSVGPEVAVDVMAVSVADGAGDGVVVVRGP